jgi:hypothetical protein
MRDLYLIAVLLLGWGTFSYSQKVVVYGTVKDQEKKSAMDNVNIFVNGIIAGQTHKGNFRITLPQPLPVELKFTYQGYNAIVKTLTRAKFGAKDSLKLELFMVSATIELTEVNITSVEKPDTVVGNNSFFIQDFEFAGDNFLLLTTDRKTDAWSVRLADKDQKILSRANIPVMDVVQLYRDFLGYINVICKEAVYRVKFDGTEIGLQQLPKNDFDWMIRPCVDTITSSIYFSNYRADYPEFSYFAYHKNDSTKVLVRSVVDKDLALQYAFEYEFLKPKDKLMARKIEQQTGIDKREVAAYMTDFAHQRWFTPLYAPMFIIRDTVLIFDHYSDKIYKYDSKNNPVDSVKISYHHPEKWREWRRQLLKDELKLDIYGVFLKGGYTYLKEIGTNNGNILSVSRLTFQFVDKVKVKDGYAYYIYRPNSSLQTKFLYKERLSVSD